MEQSNLPIMLQKEQFDALLKGLEISCELIRYILWQTEFITPANRDEKLANLVREWRQHFGE